jgi:hypothetical protein
MLGLSHRGNPVISRLLLAALALLLLLAGLPTRAAAEIPHENFELANSDMSIITAMLNSSVRASETALTFFYEEKVNDSNQYLDIIGRVLVPAGQLVEEIKNVAGSYDDLSELLPPFEKLYSGERSFSSLEDDLLGIRNEVVSLSQLENLSDADLVHVLEEIRTIYSLTGSMNNTIDEMQVAAGQITTLTVADAQPFADSNLTVLIEQLRDLIHSVIEQIDQIIHNDVNWGDATPFLLLWVADASLYLEDDLVCGGYLFFNGSFSQNHQISLVMDNNNFSTLTTGAGGSFRFSYTIPIDALWLGSHLLVAWTQTPYENLSSDEITITVSRIPTNLTISASRVLLAPNQNTAISVVLKDVEGSPIPDAEIILVRDAESIALRTDTGGRTNITWQASEIGFGTHRMSASYLGMFPYASNHSADLIITVNIPTSVYLHLSAARLGVGYRIVGNGSLFANRSTPMQGQMITLFIDGVERGNATTDVNGMFAFSIPSTNLSKGTHELRASFIHREIIWRYSDATESFIIQSPQQTKYPFFPVIPGWDTDPGVTILYLFFGENAYYTWLFVLLAIGLTIKTMQARRSRAEKEKLDLGRVKELEPVPAPRKGLSIDDFALESGARPSGPYDPNEMVVQYYNRLLGFLRRKRRVAIPDSMTHRELASFLQSIGYSRTHVQRVTELFEKAMYSGSRLSEDEAVRMTTDVSRIVGESRGGAPNAV